MKPVTVEEREGTWWLVDGAGNRFVSTGINHLQSDCWLAPYNRESMLKRYGPDLATADNRFNPDGKALPRLVEAVKEKLSDLGFDTLGIHTYDVPAALFADEFFYCVAIEYHPLGSRFRFGEQTFPDIFSNEFRDGLEEHVAAVCRQHRDNPKFIGYAFSDIPRWYFYEGQDLDRRPVHPWARDMDDSIDTREQSNAVMAHAVQHWYAMHTELIRKYDPDHLVLGDKLHSPHRIPEWFLPAIRDHVDILFVQWYTPIDRQVDTLTRLHEATGKPVINGDSTFSCPKPPRQTQVKGFKVASQEAVGQAYYDYLQGAMQLPFFIGWHHCGIVEQWDGGKLNDWEINENGLFDPFENPYPEITDRVREANCRAFDWHTGR